MNDPCELIDFSDPLALASGVAAAWIKKVEEAQSQNRTHLVALSGGRIARQFFTAIVQQAREHNLSLAQVHFFWADERCVPPDNTESNFKLANECLFQPVSISPGQLHRI